MAKRLRETIRNEDFLARLSGDEFAVILFDISADYVAGKVASKIISSINKTFRLRSYEVNVSASIGIACYPEAGNDVDSLAKSADIAMYRAKQHGRNKFHYFNEIVSEKHQKRLVIENSIGLAASKEELNLVYQPIFDLKSRKTIGVEALLRWYHPEFGLVMPNFFIPIADEMGIMPSIDQWTFRQACKQYRLWMDAGVKDFLMSINVATLKGDYSIQVEKTLKELDIPREKIYLEVTETIMMEDLVGFEDLITSIKDWGVHIAIDDFGTGYSSLSRLNHLPVSILKIDKSFVQAVGVEPGSEIIIKTILALANSLNLDVIAEGIETKEQLQFLIDNHCVYGQGFYYSKPLEVDKVLSYLKGE